MDLLERCNNISPGEEALTLLTLAPLIFFQQLEESLYAMIVAVCRIYLTLVYFVDRKNVSAWAKEARGIAKGVHELLGWAFVTLNWHLVFFPLFFLCNFLPAPPPPPPRPQFLDFLCFLQFRFAIGRPSSRGTVPCVGSGHG